MGEEERETCRNVSELRLRFNLKLLFLAIFHTSLTLTLAVHMPTLKRGRQPTQSNASNKRLTEINDAFDKAVGFVQPPSTDDFMRTTTGKGKGKGKGKARAVVFDDEEEGTNKDQDVEMKNSDQPTEGSEQAGGFMSEEQIGGGGFMPQPTYQGGGFMVDEDRANSGGGLFTGNNDQVGGQPGSSAGGFFINSDPSNSGGGGGFFAENENDHSFASAPGGRFFADDSSASPYPAYPGGGFMPIDPSDGGGFLPSVPQPLPFSSSNLDSFTLPTPPRPSRIPLSRIPQTLRTLGIPRGNDRQIMEMFEEVGSTDEEDNGHGEKSKSVRRERFIEALEVLLVDRDDEGSDDSEKEGEEDEYEEENPTNPTRRRSTRVTRQSARTNPNKQPVRDEEEGGDVNEVDFVDKAQEEENDDLSSASASEGEPTSDEEEEAVTGSTSKTRKGTASKSKSKSKRKRYDHLQPVSKKDLEAASDTFDLFFEDSPQLALGQDARLIGLAELKKVTRVLKEKFTDEDVSLPFLCFGDSK